MKIINYKKTVTGVSFVGVLLMLLFWIGSYDQFTISECRTFLKQCYPFLLFNSSIIFLFTLMFSIITYRMKDQVFKPWACFSVLFSSIYIYITLSQEYVQKEGGIFSLDLKIDWLVTIVVFNLLYIVISTLIIAIQLFRTRTRKPTL